jgi:hypothetical protein
MLKKAFVSFTLILLCAVKPLLAQDKMQMAAMEDSLLVIADSMYNAFIPDDRLEYNEKFVKHLVRALKVKDSYAYPFAKLQEKINIIAPDDKSFRIFNWAIAPTDLTRRYYGAIQMASEDLKLYPLIDYTANLGKGLEDSILNNQKWFGALYYRIIPHEVDGNTIYTLLGLNAASAISNKKVMEPLTFTPKGPVFGASIFNVRSQTNPNARINRFVIEYKKAVQASMNWDADMNAIVFDKLVSDVNDPNRKYTYVPSGEYDGFRWLNDNWNYMTNLIPIDARKDGEAPVPSPMKGKDGN